jgi:hypothetical protein
VSLVRRTVPLGLHSSQVIASYGDATLCRALGSQPDEAQTVRLLHERARRDAGMARALMTGFSPRLHPVPVAGIHGAGTRAASALDGPARPTRPRTNPATPTSVLAMGSLSPQYAQALGIRLPIYPAKGYSVTMPVKDASMTHQVSLTDDEYKLVFSRLGDRLRIAGTAELDG